MAADLLARGLAAKAFASVRARSISIEEMGATGSGNDQPAIQRAVDAAIANGIGKVVARLPRLEMWCPVRTSPYSAASDGIPLVVTAPLHLDFGGAAITLKGPGGADRFIGQPVGGYDDGTLKPWIGGWMYVVGKPAFTRVTLENVTVDGGFSGNVLSNALSNVTDKGFRIQDAFVAEVVLRNVELKNFAGEICYLGLVGDTHTLAENCHFHGSPQSAWNPAGAGRVTAINVRAGRAYAPGEIIGGPGQTYIGGQFYDGYTVGIFGGPDPTFVGGYPFVYTTRRGDAPPPFIHFHDTRFENIPGALNLTSFTRGRIVTVDTPVWLTHAGVGQLQDIDLDIESWVDRSSAYEGVGVFGPPDLVTQVAGAPAGTYYRKTSNIDVRIRCRQTALAKANGRIVNPGVRLYAGLFDRNSVRFSVTGECSSAWALNSAPPANFEVPRIVSDVAYPPAIGGGGGPVATFATDTAHRVESAALTVFHGGSGTLNVTMDLTHAYAHGQSFTFRYAGNDPSKVLAFAKNGAGLRLNADRTLRRNGEFLTLDYDKDIGLWREAGYLDQARPRELLPIDTATGLAAFSAAPWVVNNLTLASAGVAGPYGAGDATRLTLAGTSFPLLYRGSAGKRTLRARVKAGTTASVGLFIDTAAGFSQAAFDLATGSGTYDAGIDGAIAALGGGWFMIEARGQCTNNLGLKLGGSPGDTALLFDALLYDG